MRVCLSARVRLCVRVRVCVCSGGFVWQSSTLEEEREEEMSVAAGVPVSGVKKRKGRGRER